MVRIIIAFIASILLHSAFGNSLRECVINTANSQLHVREKTNNDGQEVEMYLRTCGLGKGYSWCGAYVKWIYLQHCISTPDKAEWSPNWGQKFNRTEEPKPADTFTIYSYTKKRIVHVGLVRTVEGNSVYTNEGNTNSGGSANGDGVYNRIRDKKTIYSFNNWIYE